MVIYLDQYRVARAVPVKVFKNGNYGGGILNANCNPALVLLPVPSAPEVWPLEDLATADIEALLGNIYALATQI
jgi:hypothetical protein